MRFRTMSDSEIITELCHRMRETRIQSGLSQIELAERAHVGIATIKRAELGKSVTLMTLIGIMRGLDSLNDLNAIFFASQIRTFNIHLACTPRGRARIRKKKPLLKHGDSVTYSKNCEKSRHRRE